MTEHDRHIEVLERDLQFDIERDISIEFIEAKQYAIQCLKQPRRKLSEKKIKIITERYCTICMNQEDFIKALCDPKEDLYE